MWDPASETTGRPQHWGILIFCIHSIHSSVALFVQFLMAFYLYYNYLNADLLLMWGAQYSILPWHLACLLDPEGLAVLYLPEKRNNRYLETIKQHNYTNKDYIKFNCTHWFTNRSNRPDFTLYTAFTLWGEGQEVHQKRREPRGAKHVAHTVRTVFPADPIVPGRPGCPASPWAESGFGNYHSSECKN